MYVTYMYISVYMLVIEMHLIIFFFFTMADAPFPAITATRFKSVFMGSFDHSAKSAFDDNDVGREGVAPSLCLNSPQRWLCAGQSSPSTPNSSMCWTFSLGTGVQSGWNMKGPFANCSHRFGSIKVSNGISWNGTIIPNSFRFIIVPLTVDCGIMTF